MKAGGKLGGHFRWQRRSWGLDGSRGGFRFGYSLLDRLEHGLCFREGLVVFMLVQNLGKLLGGQFNRFDALEIETGRLFSKLREQVFQGVGYLFGGV